MAPGALHLTPSAAGARHQREKLAVLTAFANEALQAVPGFDATPALHALAALAAAEHPEHFQWDGSTANSLGVRLRAQDGHTQRISSGSFGLGDEVSRCLLGLPTPWRLAGLLSLAFVEDFAIVDASGPGPATLPWMAVSLPSFWAPAEKCGMAFAQAHAPVADNALLMQAADGLTRLVTGSGPDNPRWERFVWTITPHTRLHALPAHVDPARWQGRFDPAQAWWRTERQTFMARPAQQQALFTIAVQVQPLAQALTTDQARRLHAAVASMSAAVLAYRGLTDVHQPLLNWLDGQAQSQTA